MKRLKRGERSSSSIGIARVTVLAALVTVFAAVPVVAISIQMPMTGSRYNGWPVGTFKSGGGIGNIEYQDFPQQLSNNGKFFVSSWFFQISVQFNFTDTRSPCPPSMRTADGAYLDHTMSNGTHVRLECPMVTYSGPGNATAACQWQVPWYDGLKLVNAMALVKGSTTLITMTHRCTSVVSVGGWFLSYVKEETFDKYFAQAGNYDYYSCDNFCKSRNAQLAVQHTKAEYDELFALVPGSDDYWVGLVNWGKTNTSQDWLCWESMPTFTLDGCRAADTSRGAYGLVSACLQAYCPPDLINEPGNRVGGNTAFRITRSIGLQDIKKTDKAKGCLCQYLTAAGSTSGTYLKDSSELTLFFFVVNDTYAQVGDLATPTGSDSPTQMTQSLTRGTISATSSDATSSRSFAFTTSLTSAGESDTVSETWSEMLAPSTEVTLSSSLPQSLSATLGFTNTATLMAPWIDWIEPSTFQLSEKAITAGRGEGITITLKAHRAQWDCRFIIEARHEFFSVPAPTTPAPRTQSSNTTTQVNAQPEEFGFARRYEFLLPQSAISCSGSDLAFTFSRDREYSIERNENISLNMEGPKVLLYNPRINRNVRFAANFAIVDDKAPPAIEIPKAVMESAKSTAAASSVVASAAGNPAVAVQGARTALILALAECEDSTEEGLEVLSHPTQLEIGLGITGSWAGACFWNPIIVLAQCWSTCLLADLLQTKGQTYESRVPEMLLPSPAGHDHLAAPPTNSCGCHHRFSSIRSVCAARISRHWLRLLFDVPRVYCEDYPQVWFQSYLRSIPD